MLRIRKRPGDAVARGEPIHGPRPGGGGAGAGEGGPGAPRGRNQQEKTRLELQARLDDLESQREVKTLQLGALQAQTSGTGS